MQNVLAFANNRITCRFYWQLTNAAEPVKIRFVSTAAKRSRISWRAFTGTSRKPLDKLARCWHDRARRKPDCLRGNRQAQEESFKTLLTSPNGHGMMIGQPSATAFAAVAKRNKMQIGP